MQPTASLPKGTTEPIPPSLRKRKAEAAPASKRALTAVGRLIEMTEPDAFPVRAVRVGSRMAAAMAITGGLLFSLGWARAYFGRSLAKALSIKRDGKVMDLIVCGAAVVIGASVAYLVMHLSSKRWVKFRWR